MLNFWRINSEQELVWRHNPLDLFTFVIVVATIKQTLGFSTYVICNRKQQNVVSSKINSEGLFTVNRLSQFDVKTETGVEGLQNGMAVIGLGAL